MQSLGDDQIHGAISESANTSRVSGNGKRPTEMQRARSPAGGNIRLNSAVSEDNPSSHGSTGPTTPQGRIAGSVLSGSVNSVEGKYATFEDLRRIEGQIHDLASLISSWVRPETNRQGSLNFVNNREQVALGVSQNLAQPARHDEPTNTEPRATPNNTRNIKFWGFYKHDPLGWFRQLQDLFTFNKVTDDEAKFNFVGTHLDADIYEEIHFLLNSLTRGHKYEGIKKILIGRYAKSSEQQLSRLFQGVDWGSRKPSEALAK